MKGTSEVAPEAVRQAVGGGRQSGCGRYCRFQMPMKLALAVGGTVAGHRLGALEGGGGGGAPPLLMQGWRGGDPDTAGRFTVRQCRKGMCGNKRTL